MGFNNSNTEIIEQHYQGFCSTPNLWFGDAIFGLNQFESKIIPNTPFTDANVLPQRLGKRVEHFVCNDLEHQPNIKLLVKNLQIQNNQHSIGELDTLLLVNDSPVHLEIVYKFYVYDDTVGSTPLEHWIGPNRKDSLVQKLNKLIYKQLPLLFKPETKIYLEGLDFNLQQVTQQVLFKAQLFVPRYVIDSPFETINPDCIAGTYIKRDALPAFKNTLFYIPSKLNWLISIQPDVPWLSYSQFLEAVSVFLDRQLAPLIWMKHPDGNIERCFVVWW